MIEARDSMKRSAQLSTGLLCLAALLLLTRCATHRELMREAAHGHTKTVQTLLTHGVQVNRQDKHGATALMLAAARGHTDVVTTLLAKGADVNLQHTTGQTALMLAVVGGHSPVWWQKRLTLEQLTDLDSSLARVEAALRELQTGGRAGKTVSNYAEALAAFCDWCVERGYFVSDSLKNLRGFDTTPQT